MRTPHRAALAVPLGLALTLPVSLTVPAAASPASTHPPVTPARSDAAAPHAAVTPPAPTTVGWAGDLGSGLGSAIGSTSCDVNGDRHPDVVTGAWFWSRAPHRSTGAAYVLLGSDRPRGGALADPRSASAVRINGPEKDFTNAGFSVACLGDTNGDHYGDIAISDFSDKRVYVVYGQRDFTSLNLDAMGSRGYIVQAPADAGNFGYQVSALGDVNHDGRADLGVTAVAASSLGRKANGRAWVIAGAPGTTTVDVSTSPRVLGTIEGARSTDRLSALASAGDVNGDGIDDLVAGAYVAVPEGQTGTARGAAYVVYGHRDGRIGQVDTAALGDGAPGSRGFVIAGPTRDRDRLGVSVAPAGDINHDGLADLVIGADGVPNAASGPRAGGAAVVYGARSTRSIQVDPTAARPVVECAAAGCDNTSGPARGWWIEGAADGDSTGYSVAGIGDVNGDATPDIAVGAYGADATAADGTTLTTAGKAYVVNGQTASAVIRLADLTPAQGTVVQGTQKGERLGRAVAGVGDVDRNGRPDVAVGGDHAGTGSDRAGDVQLVREGRANRSGSTTGVLPRPQPNPFQLPAPIPASVPASMAFSDHNWKPTAADTCPEWLHERYSMVGSDGRKYPTWHPAQVINPRTGRMCSFGHEHGDDPRTSHIYGMVSDFLSAPHQAAKGIPFGMTSEASMAWDKGMDMRHEDNAGHKVIVRNDVQLLNPSDRSPIMTKVGLRTVPLTCDYLIKLHQGSHSSDATKNNAHELVYGVSCNDGTRAVISTLSRLGNPNEYNRGCQADVVVKTSGSNLPAGDGGRRLIPDTTCIDAHELVPEGQQSDIWGLYELWQTANRLTTTDGTVLASYDPWLGVRNPSRVADAANPGQTVATVNARWATDPADQGITRGWPWSGIPDTPKLDQYAVTSPFNGAQRDVWLGGTVLNPVGGRTVWYSDPYGRNAQGTPFEGSVPQLLVRPSGAAAQDQVERVQLGLEDDFGAPGTGVHAPN